MYLTYAEYTNYGGTLDETIFDNVNYTAQSYIDWVTFNRLQNETTYPEAVKRCVYELIRLINNQKTMLSPSEDGTKVVYSMSNDGVSQTYSMLTAEQLYGKMTNEIKRIIKQYLNGVKNSKNHLVLYRGKYCDE